MLVDDDLYTQRRWKTDTIYYGGTCNSHVNKKLKEES